MMLIDEVIPLYSGEYTIAVPSTYNPYFENYNFGDAPITLLK